MGRGPLCLSGAFSSQGGDQERDEKVEPPRDVEPVHPELAQQEHGTPKPRDQEGAVNALAFPVRLTLHI